MLWRWNLIRLSGGVENLPWQMAPFIQLNPWRGLNYL